jgi:hypothetical protein
MTTTTDGTTRPDNSSSMLHEESTCGLWPRCGRRLFAEDEGAYGGVAPVYELTLYASQQVIRTAFCSPECLALYVSVLASPAAATQATTDR